MSGELEFSFVDKPTIHSYTNLQTMTRPTLMKYKDLVKKGVEKLISKNITDTFGVVFDNWTHITTHSFPIYLCYISNKAGELCYPLNAFSPLLDETSMNAYSHVEFLRYALLSTHELLKTLSTFLATIVH